MLYGENMKSPRTLLLLLFSALLAFGQAAGEQMFDVRNGDQKGKLIVRGSELQFESLTDAKHSRTWKYVDIRAFEKKMWRWTIRVRPFQGSQYDFQFPNGQARDKVYDAIAPKVLSARMNKK